VPLAPVLASVAQRVLAGGGRLLVVTGDEGQAALLDDQLWAGEDMFLPHGRDGGDQPVLIASDCIAANGARHVALTDGVWREAALGFDRAFHFFDEDTIAAARTAWREVKARDGIEPRYWRQEDGRWRQVA
jgi:DNA polymerase-3 subunit chi